MWSLAAIVCLVGAASALLVGEQALASAHDLHAIYWLVTGGVTLKACFAVAGGRE